MNIIPMRADENMQKKNRRIGLIICGARGRMGSLVFSLAASDPHFIIKGLVERPDHCDIGKEIILNPEGGKKESIKIKRDFPDSICKEDIVIDFSTGKSVPNILKLVEKHQAKFLSGTTGMNGGCLENMRRYSTRSAVFHDANMSFGIALLRDIMESAGPLLRNSFDIEIVEHHHRSKVDKPSGTALLLASSLAGHAGNMKSHGEAEDTRRPQIHIHSIRAGGTAGDHEVICSADAEIVSFKHRALSREIFARGALKAAMFLAHKKKGFFSMRDIVKDRDA